MTDMIRSLVIAAGLALPGLAAAQAQLVIGHVALTDDPRYMQDWGYARLITPPPVHSVQGAEMAIADLSFVAEAAGITTVLDAREGTDLDAIQTAVAEMIGAGTEFIILDLPGDMVAAVAGANADTNVTLINAGAGDDALRGMCQPNLLHAAPSDRMLMDSFAQYLRFMDWMDALVLVGEDPHDAGLAAVFQTSAERLGLSIVETRPFTLAADPEQREGNNVSLLTGGADYDVVFVADTRGEFGRYVPYSTQLPRPVIGSVGLTAQAWHWAMERDGATQVSSRFDKATGRKMSSVDWAAWIAVKSVVTAFTRSPDTSRAAVTDFMRSDAMRLDGSKGVTLNYRPWDNQMRMPMLLATADAVIAIAPLDGFMHQTNTLDTLGVDEPEFACN